MSYSGILATVNLYKTEKSMLTNELGNILMDITNASRQTSTLTQTENEEKANLYEEYGGVQGESESPTSYEIRQNKLSDGKDEVQSKFEAQAADINAWEAELEVQKQNKETQVQATGSYLDSFMEVLKNNIKKDSTYGQGAK